MKYQVYENDYISKHLGTFELPEDADADQIDAAVGEILQQNSIGSLCHHCSTSVGDLSGSGEITVEDENGEPVRDDSYRATLEGEVESLKQRIAELEKQLAAAQEALKGVSNEP